MPQAHPSTESSAPRQRTVWIGALVVLAMAVVYAVAFVAVSRHEILAENLEWIHTVAARLVS